MKYLYQNKHWEINKEYNLNKLLYLMIDRPSEIDYDYNLIWYNNKTYYHRDYDLPSEICAVNNMIVSLSWFKEGKQHREKFKPAYIQYDGYKAYFTNDDFNKIEQPK